MVRRCIILLLACPALLSAGTNGILEGRVQDKRTHEFLPGVSVAITGLLQGASTDTGGRYEVQNIRAGRYEIRFSRIGYQTFVVKNVVINPDLRTRLNVDLEASDVELGEVVVVQEKPLIQRDVTGTTFIVASEDIQALPVDRATDVIGYKAGVTLEGNVRGGKTTEVVYLVDGLPVTDVIAGGLATNLPNSSIVGMSIYTGGFEPEYGNALSGVVNIVTRAGTNEHKFFARGDKDDVHGGSQTSRTRDVEVSASGPIEENTMYYVAAVNGFLTDTRWWQDLKEYFPSPVDKTINGFGKVDYLFTPSLRLGAQVLYSYHDWHDYEFDWRFNLSGLPPQRKTSNRIAAIISHSVSDRFFYTASLSRFQLQTRIGSESREDIPANDPYQYDFFLRYVVAGQRAWWNRSTQNTYTAKFDGTFKPREEHLVKFGAEANFYHLSSDVVKYEPQKTYFGKPIIGEPQLNFSTSYSYNPTSGSVYVQDKIDLPSEGILINAGLRYDFLNPTATRPAIENIPITDSTFATVSREAVRASLKQQISPRVGAAMQLTERGYFFVNVGWYFQYPLFDYLYAGLDRVALARGISALTGNPDLEPERTQSYELSIRYVLGFNMVASVTYFKKETSNQVDSKTFVPGDSKVAGTFGFAEYVNSPFGEARGVEIVLARERGEWVTGEFSYTYMVAEGTSGSANDGFYIAQFGLPPGTRIYPLSWDQRHTVKLTANLSLPTKTNINMFVQYHSGRPYTSYPTATGFEPIDGGRFYQNNARMPRYLNVDLKATQAFTLACFPGVQWTGYLDVRNLLNTQNVSWIDSNDRIGGELGDPSGYFIGRRASLGIQADF